MQHSSKHPPYLMDGCRGGGQTHLVLLKMMDIPPESLRGGGGGRMVMNRSIINTPKESQEVLQFKEYFSHFLLGESCSQFILSLLCRLASSFSSNSTLSTKFAKSVSFLFHSSGLFLYFVTSLCTPSLGGNVTTSGVAWPGMFFLQPRTILPQ